MLYAVYRSNRVEWLIELARRGSGAAILPETNIPKAETLRALPLKGVNTARNVVALRYRHQSTRPETSELIKEIARGG